jgi:hypothetical protein
MASTLKINTLTGVTTAGSIAVTGEGNSTTTNLQYSRIISHQGSTTSSIRCRCSNSSDYTTYSNNRGSSAIHGDLA